MVDIKDISGNILFSTPINEGCKRKFTLQKEDYIILKFSVDNPIYFKLGDGIDDENIGLFELADVKNGKPTYNESTSSYDYELQLDAYYWKWKNKKFKYTPESGGKEASWNLTATLDVHMGIFLRNLTALGYTYRGVAFQFSIDSTVENSAKLVSYDNTNMIDALTAMAEAWNCEWWVTDNIIHFGRCEFGDPVDFEIGVNVESMPRSDSQTDYATRIIAFGSTKNIPTNYRPVDEQIVVNGVVQRRLMLPEGTPCVDAYENMSEEEAVENIITFDDVYPRFVGTISEITETTGKYTDEDENETGETYPIYTFKDTSLKNFTKDYLLDELRLIFQSGSLNGLDFALTLKSSDDTGTTFEIVRNDNYGRDLPDDTLKPVVGDTYSLYGFDTSYISDQLMDDAEQELLEKTQAYVAKTKIDPSTYDCKMSPVYMYNDGDIRTFEIGDKVNLINKGYFKDGRVSRIIGFEYNLDYPYDNPVYTIGETAAYSRIGDIEDKVDAVTYKGQTYTGNGSGVYVIRTNDETIPTDSNVFSAKRSMSMFLRKDKEDTAKEILKFLKGLKVGEDYVSGVSGGFLGLDENGKVYAEVDKLLVRVKAYFEQLEIKDTYFIAGREIVSPGGGLKCTKVEEIDSGYKCSFCADDGDTAVVNYFQVNDFAIGKTFNIKAGVYTGVSNHYFWRKVIEVGDDYIVLSKTVCDADSDAPEKGDNICQLGNDTDPDRQAAIIISTVDLNAPSITLLDGINTFSLTDKDVLSFGYDATDHEAYMKVYGHYYVGAKDESSYIKYTKTGGVEIVGKFTSASSGKSIEDIEAGLDDVTEQADRCWILWIETEEPTLANSPAVDWDTDVLKKEHVKDIVMIKDSSVSSKNGRAWRFTEINNGDGTVSYEWNEITDQYLLDALALANSKRRVFVVQPTDDDEYDVGDLWTNATWLNADGSYLYENDILRCVTAKIKGTAFSISDWTLATKYSSALIKSEDDRVLLAATNAAADASSLASAANSLANSAYNEAYAAYNKAVGAQSDADTNTQNISALRVDVNSIVAVTEKLSFDSSGNVTNIDKSGLVLTSDFATLFSTQVDSEGIAHTASIQAYVDDAVSNISITADNVSIGGTNLANIFSVMSWGSSSALVSIVGAGLYISPSSGESLTVNCSSVQTVIGNTGIYCMSASSSTTFTKMSPTEIRIQYGGYAATMSMSLSKLIFNAIFPTSNSGLATNTIWNDNGTLKIVT